MPTVWQGSTASRNEEDQLGQQRLCPHGQVIWCKRRSRSVGQNHRTFQLCQILRGGLRVVHEPISLTPRMDGKPLWECIWRTPEAEHWSWCPAKEVLDICSEDVL